MNKSKFKALKNFVDLADVKKKTLTFQSDQIWQKHFNFKSDSSKYWDANRID